MQGQSSSSSPVSRNEDESFSLLDFVSFHVFVFGTAAYIPFGTGDSTLIGTLIFMSWGIILDDVGVVGMAVTMSLDWAAEGGHELSAANVLAIISASSYFLLPEMELLNFLLPLNLLQALSDLVAWKCLLSSASSNK
ncbi:hypothetical protein WA026_022531 [Henosepilachna vigintioctopunctata]|uniref:Uncharacterized protein n=1 Tax=Henosepilachna vigintioctopunctata TaxID=420089 RepID=A0AAW1UHY6_9CUCU